jgi:hypothetical protein
MMRVGWIIRHWKRCAVRQVQEGESPEVVAGCCNCSTIADFDILEGNARRRAFAALFPPPVIPLSQWARALRLYPYQR